MLFFNHGVYMTLTDYPILTPCISPRKKLPISLRIAYQIDFRVLGFLRNDGSQVLNTV